MTDIGCIDRFEYRVPLHLDEALDILKTKSDTTKILAGGTDLVLQMKQGQVRPSLVVDIKKIPEVNILEWSKRNGLRLLPAGRGCLLPAARSSRR